MGLGMFIKKDKAFNKELRFIYHSIFEWNVKEWVLSVLQKQVKDISEEK